ncbi:MAG: gas vesicle protein K [Nitriliruptor sp.]
MSTGPTGGDPAITDLDLSGELDRLLERGRSGDASPEDVQRGLAALVLVLVEVLRELMERQAIRRMDSGSLDDEEIERLGRTFLALRERMEELKVTFGLTDEDLNLDLGPLGRLR